MSGNQTSGEEGVQGIVIVVSVYMLDIVYVCLIKRNSSLPFFCRPTASPYAS